MSEIGPSRVTVRTLQKCEYTIRLERDITCPDDFAEEFACLQQAGPDDVVRFLLLSAGGELGTGLQLIRAIKACQATTIGVIGLDCASAASAVALACDGWEVDEMSSMMVHTASISFGQDKLRNVAAAANHSQKMIERFIDSTYTGFLTEEEILDVKNGKDLYFEGEDLADRLNTFADYRESLVNVAEAA